MVPTDRSGRAEPRPVIVGPLGDCARPRSIAGVAKRDGFWLSQHRCSFTSPRLRGDVGFYAKRKIRVRGTLRALASSEFAETAPHHSRCFASAFFYCVRTAAAGRLRPLPARAGRGRPTCTHHALADQRRRKSGDDLDEIGLAADAGLHKHQINRCRSGNAPARLDGRRLNPSLLAPARNSCPGPPSCRRQPGQD